MQTTEGPLGIQDTITMKIPAAMLSKELEANIALILAKIGQCVLNREGPQGYVDGNSVFELEQHYHMMKSAKARLDGQDTVDVQV